MFDEKLVSERLDLRDFDDVQEAFLARAWTDGLPIIPPTEMKVREMIAGRTPRAGRRRPSKTSP